jgi:hypothetical protein
VRRGRHRAEGVKAQSGRFFTYQVCSPLHYFFSTPKKNEPTRKKLVRHFGSFWVTSARPPLYPCVRPLPALFLRIAPPRPRTRRRLLPPAPCPRRRPVQPRASQRPPLPPLPPAQRPACFLRRRGHHRLLAPSSGCRPHLQPRSRPRTSDPMPWTLPSTCPPPLDFSYVIQR